MKNGSSGAADAVTLGRHVCMLRVTAHMVDASKQVHELVQALLSLQRLPDAYQVNSVHTRYQGQT